MFKVAFKGVMARKGRVLTPAIAVLLGVASVTGTLVRLPALRGRHH